MDTLIIRSHPLPADLKALAAKARALLANTVSAATKRGYASDFFGDWKVWAENHNAPVLPAEPEWICLYLADRSSTLKAATLARRLNAISYYHRKANCLLSPTHHPLVRETFKAIRREIGTRQKIKQALLTDDVRKIVAYCPDSPAGKRDKALYLVSFAGMLRREDSAGLMVEGLQFTSEGLVMTLDHGKTDQESRGREISIVPGADPATCPLRALRDWLDSAKLSSGPVFRAVDQKGRVSISGLHRDSIAYILKRAAARAGFKVKNIAGHSLRSGGITTAAENGVPEYIIRRQSHHSPASKSFHRYIVKPGPASTDSFSTTPRSVPLSDVLYLTPHLLSHSTLPPRSTTPSHNHSPQRELPWGTLAQRSIRTLVPASAERKEMNRSVLNLIAVAERSEHGYADVPPGSINEEIELELATLGYAVALSDRLWIGGYRIHTPESILFGNYRPYVPPSIFTSASSGSARVPDARDFDLEAVLGVRGEVPSN
jgi:site-specific recombinase XerD